MEHTPGPWNVIDDQDLIEDNYNGIDFPNGSNLIGCINKPTAQLIAAAPDLLEALKAVLTHNRDVGTFWTDAHKNAQKAIDKAEGK